MTFDEILPFLKDGKTIRRKKTNSFLVILISNKRIVSRHTSENNCNKYGFYNLRYEDIVADDWEICF